MPPASKANNGSSVAAANGARQWRKLRGYAFDPVLSQQFETAGINEIVFRVPWEKLEPGPVGEYLEVVDYDPASKAFYEPVNLDGPRSLGADGVDPDEGDPHFHQQFVYTVAMLTIRNFEEALGRKVFWTRWDKTKPHGEWETFVPRLRIYPHAFRGENAYYTPQKIALLFCYFSAYAAPKGVQLPGGMVFTCLSHDVIAHETTHSLLDSVLPRYLDSTNPDALAFHEAFADIVALFQHFSFPEVLRHQIAKTRGDLTSESLLGELASQFGQATGNYGGLREAIGKFDDNGKWTPLKPDPTAYDSTDEPHDRGSLLVAAVFDSFLAMYRERVADLMRIATGGYGILPAGALSPDLVERLSREASRTAQHLLGICIRALDYCPPVDITFGDYLRALITADVDLVPEDQHHYRVAIIEAFRRRGLYPRDLRTLSEQSLRWPSGAKLDEAGQEAVASLAKTLESLANHAYRTSRREIFDFWREFRKKIHQTLLPKTDVGNLEKVTGLVLDTAQDVPGLKKSKETGKYEFEIHSVRPVHRHGPGGEEIDDIVLSITQRRVISVDGVKLLFPGGCTLILDLETLKLRYAIRKSITDPRRKAALERWYKQNPAAVARADESMLEPIRQLHLSA